jgi:6-phosphofructokinase 1
VKAAIVSCGGLCPGLNVVIREIFMCLRYSYGVQDVYGVKWGYNGFWKHPDYWVKLTSELVVDIHKKGGSIIGAARGGFDADKILTSLIDRNVNLLFVIGGDGTHYACNMLIEEINKRGLGISVCGIPKTIDNDIPLIDKSFGYETSCEYANKIVEAANVEAESIPNGVGLVKVMGRDSGFIAMTASLSN